MSEISNSIKKIGEELLNLAALFDGAETTEEPGPTFEEVRATLADISRKGKTMVFRAAGKFQEDLSKRKIRTKDR